MSTKDPHATGSQQTFDIWSIRPGGRGFRRLTNTDADEMLFDFSPDGRHILFGRVEAPDWIWQLWQMRRDGSHQRMLATMGSDDSVHANYSPDGTMILASWVETCEPVWFCLLERDGTIIGGIGAPSGWEGSSWQARRS